MDVKSSRLRYGVGVVVNRNLLVSGWKEEMFEFLSFQELSRAIVSSFSKDCKWVILVFAAFEPKDRPVVTAEEASVTLLLRAVAEDSSRGQPKRGKKQLSVLMKDNRAISVGAISTR